MPRSLTRPGALRLGSRKSLWELDDDIIDVSLRERPRMH